MLTFLAALVVIPLAYALGSVPFGLLLTQHYKGVDIRTIGSGNIGATNVLRTGDKKLAAMTLFCDAMKGMVAVWIAQSTGSDWVVALAGIAVVCGHIFPYSLQFKGGKGVATTLAVFWAVSWPMAIFACLVWLGTFFVFRTSSLAAIMAMAVSPIFGYFFGGSGSFLMCIVLASLVIYRHKENIQRLMEGKEIPLDLEKK